MGFLSPSMEPSSSPSDQVSRNQFHRHQYGRPRRILLGVGAIVGSAIFNILVIPALSAFASEELEATRDIVHKDAQFYIISILVLFIMFALGATYVPGDESHRDTDTHAGATPTCHIRNLRLSPPAGRQRIRR